MKEEIIKALTIIEEEEHRTKRDIEIIHKAKEEIERLNNIIDKAIECIIKREWGNCEDCVNQVYDILEGEDND